MIFINKPDTVPSKLIEFQTAMVDSIGMYRCFDRIPEEELKTFIKGYSHLKVKEALFNCSHQKCSYCEVIPTGSSLRVDHFFPKILYPDLILDWDNLLPSCENCNTRKSSHDTKNEPIINPSKINPLPNYDFDFIRMIPSVDSPDPFLTKRTIEVCDLNRRELLNSRANLLVDLNEVQEYINDVLKDFREPMTPLKIKRRIIKLEDLLESIEERARDTELFSAFVKKYLEKSIYIQEVKRQIINIKNKHEELFN